MSPGIYIIYYISQYRYDRTVNIKISLKNFEKLSFVVRFALRSSKYLFYSPDFKYIHYMYINMGNKNLLNKRSQLMSNISTNYFKFVCRY